MHIVSTVWDLSFLRYIADCGQTDSNVLSAGSVEHNAILCFLFHSFERHSEPYVALVDVRLKYAVMRYA